MNPAIDFSRRHLSFEEYLVREENEDERHEYIDGEVVAMAGATDNHELVAVNLLTAIYGHLRGKGCRVYKGDMKLRFQTGEVDLGYYPDIMVVDQDPDRPRAWLYRRENGWTMPPAVTGGEIRLHSIDLTLLLGNLYRA